MNWKKSLKKFEIIDSTNDQLKRYLDDKSNYRIVVASKQTNGRGQVNKSFKSPEGGLYFSIALKANYAMSKLKYLTIRVGLVIKEVLDDLYSVNIQLKWINDLILNRKKLGGILVETKFDSKNNLEYIVVGIGINLLKQNFNDSQLTNKTISLDINNYQSAIDDILNALIPRLFGLENDFDIPTIMKDYNKSLFLKNETVEIISSKNSIDCKLITVNNDLSITIEKNNKYLRLDYGHYKIVYPEK